MADAYTRLGDFEEARRWIDRAVKASPRRVVREHAQFLLASGQYDYALEVIREEMMALEASGLGETGTMLPIIKLTGVIEAWGGDYSAAALHLGRAFDWADGWASTDPTWIALLAYSLDQLGELEKAKVVNNRGRSILDNARAQGLAEFPRMIMGLARLHAVAGEREEALTKFEQAVAKGWRDYYLEIGNPIWRDYEKDETFKRLMGEVKIDVDRMLALVKENKQ